MRPFIEGLLSFVNPGGDHAGKTPPERLTCAPPPDGWQEPAGNTRLFSPVGATSPDLAVVTTRSFVQLALAGMPYLFAMPW
jgi:hypothetical protein